MSDQTYNRIDFATQQIDDAISLFFKRHYDCAWSFAAPADEIVRKALSDSGKESFQWEYQPCGFTEAEDIALWIIVRACRNYDLLGLPRTEKMREFENWFYEQVVGPADSPEVSNELSNEYGY
jgi:hypothetical protein